MLLRLLLLANTRLPAGLVPRVLRFEVEGTEIHTVGTEIQQPADNKTLENLKIRPRVGVNKDLGLDRINPEKIRITFMKE